MEKVKRPSKWTRRIRNAKRRVRQVWMIPVCILFHQKDHLCWDDLWEKNPKIRLPGNRCWMCNRCKRAWHSPNPVVFQTDFSNDKGFLPEKYWPKPALPFEIRIRTCKCQKEKKNAEPSNE